MSDWWNFALCREVDAELFFPETGVNAGTAKSICASCEVREACLADALATDDRFGVRGGLSALERRKLQPGRPGRKAAA